MSEDERGYGSRQVGRCNPNLWRPISTMDVVVGFCVMGLPFVLVVLMLSLVSSPRCDAPVTHDCAVADHGDFVD